MDGQEDRAGREDPGRLGADDLSVEVTAGEHEMGAEGIYALAVVPVGVAQQEMHGDERRRADQQSRDEDTAAHAHSLGTGGVSGPGRCRTACR